EIIVILFIFAVMIFSGFLVAAVSGSDPGKQLIRNFVALGNMTGKSRADIEKIVGPPSKTSVLEDGKILCQWVVADTKVALMFRDDIFAGVSQEFSDYQ